MSSIWDTTVVSDVTGRGQYLEPGKYLFRLQACKDHVSPVDGKQRFIAELEVIESNNDKYQPGSSVTWIRGGFEDKVKKKMAGGDVLEFCTAVLGFDPHNQQAVNAVKSWLSQNQEQVTGEKNFFATATGQDGQPGYLVRCEAWHKQNKTNAGVFTVTRWTPYSQTPAAA